MADRAAYPNMSEHMLEQVCDENGVWYYPQHGNGIYNEVSEIAELVTGGGTGSASAAWRAYDAAGTPGYLRDATGNGHTAALGATPRATLTGEALQLPGTSGNYASVPDEAALDITGDIDIRCAAALGDWTPAAVQNVVSKWSSSTGYLVQVLTSGHLRFGWDAVSGTTTADSSVAPTVTDGALLLVRATRGQTSGEVKFYTKSSTPSTAAADLAADTGWTQLGTTVTGRATSAMGTNSRSVDIGAREGTALPVAGRIYAAVIKDGIDGTTVLDVDFTGNTGATSFTADTGQTVTINRSAAGTDVPKFLEHDGDDYVWLPGTSGNYVELAPDVNLLDANTAHLEQGVGKWGTWYGSHTPVSATTSASGLPFGTKVLKVTDASPSAGGIRTSPGTAGFPATPGQQYSWSMQIRVSALPSIPKTIRLGIEFFDSGGTSLGAVTFGTIKQVTTEFQYVDSGAGKVAPASAAYFAILSDYDFTGNTASDFLEFGNFCVRTGSDPTFVPSTRIAGDVDLRAKAALTDWTPAAVNGVVDKFFTTEGYALQVFNGNLRLAFYASGTVVESSSATVPFADGEVGYIRATLDADTGASAYAVKFYTSTDGASWTQLGTTKSGAGAKVVATGSAAIEVGPGDTQMLAGKIYAAEVRDGIDGPIVASFNANAITEPHTTFVTPEGHTATLKRSASGLVTAVVDRSLFVLDGSDDFLTVPDHADLNFASGDFSVLLVGRLHTNATTQTTFISKRADSTTSTGWLLVAYGSVGEEMRLDLRTDTAEDKLVRALNHFDARFSTTQVVGAVRENASSELMLVDDTGRFGSNGGALTDSVSNALPLRVGQLGTAGGFGAFEFIGAAVFKGTALTDAQIAAVAKYLGAER